MAEPAHGSWIRNLFIGPKLTEREKEMLKASKRNWPPSKLVELGFSHAEIDAIVATRDKMLRTGSGVVAKGKLALVVAAVVAAGIVGTQRQAFVKHFRDTRAHMEDAAKVLNVSPERITPTAVAKSAVKTFRPEIPVSRRAARDAGAAGGAVAGLYAAAAAARKVSGRKRKKTLLRQQRKYAPRKR